MSTWAVREALELADKAGHSYLYMRTLGENSGASG